MLSDFTAMRAILSTSVNLTEKISRGNFSHFNLQKLNPFAILPISNSK